MVRGPSRSGRGCHGEPLRPRRGARRVAVDYGPHIGRRLSLRYRLPDERGDTEVFGVLQSVSHEGGVQRLKIMDKRGREHLVPVTDVVVAKVI